MGVFHAALLHDLAQFRMGAAFRQDQAQQVLPFAVLVLADIDAEDARERLRQRQILGHGQVQPLRPVGLHHRGEQGRFAGKQPVQGLLGDFAVRSDVLGLGGAIALGQEQAAGAVHDEPALGFIRQAFRPAPALATLVRHASSTHWSCCAATNCNARAA